jgi:hypothetical protein
VAFDFVPCDFSPRFTHREAEGEFNGKAKRRQKNEMALSCSLLTLGHSGHCSDSPTKLGYSPIMPDDSQVL